MAAKRTSNPTLQAVNTGEGKIRASGTFSALKHRNYQLFMGGQLISVAGTWMQIIAQGWLVYQLTHSELVLGIVGFASAIPALLISPWGGVVVDLVSKRNLLIITQSSAMILAFILAALAFSGAVQVWQIILLAAGLGVVNAFDAPARQAFVVEMVGREDLSNAIALNSMVFNSGRIIGPALGGLLLAAFGPAWCFFINGVSFLAVITGLLGMQIQSFKKNQIITSPWKQLTSGIHYTLAHRELFAIVLLATIFSVFGMSYSAVLPAFVDKALQAGASGFGAINALTGVGAVAGALFVARGFNFSQRGTWLIRANVFFGVILLVFANNHSFLAALLLATGLGFGFMVQFTLMNTLLQTRVADEMRGRVMSLYTLTFFGFAPFGNLAIGSLSETWGLERTIGMSAIVLLTLSSIVFIAIPTIRKLA